MKYFILFMLVSFSVRADYQLFCMGSVRVDSKVFYSEWVFNYNQIDGLVDINYSKLNRKALFKISFNENGNINGSGKWILKRRNSNSFLKILYKIDEKVFIFKDILDLDDGFRAKGKCN